MSVNATHYVILGIKFTVAQLKKQMPPCPDGVYPDDWSCKFLEGYEDNGYREKITSKNGLTCVYDGMGSEYIVIGKVIRKGLDTDGIRMTKAAYNRSDLLQIKNRIKKYLGLTSTNAGLFVFTHWH